MPVMRWTYNHKLWRKHPLWARWRIWEMLPSQYSQESQNWPFQVILCRHHHDTETGPFKFSINGIEWMLPGQLLWLCTSLNGWLCGYLGYWVQTGAYSWVMAAPVGTSIKTAPNVFCRGTKTFYLQQESWTMSNSTRWVTHREWIVGRCQFESIMNNSLPSTST